MRTVDVVIIGAGLAGLQCAKQLGRSGASVLLVDRKSDLTKGIHTTGIFVRKTFEDFAFPAGTLGPPIHDVTLYSPQLRSMDLSSDVPEFRVGKMDALYSALLEDCKSSGVEFARSTKFIKLETRDDHSTITLESDGEAFDVTAKVVVGADGAVSNIAKALRLDENREWIVGFEEVYHSQRAKREPRLHCFLDAKLAPGYLAWVADDGEEIHVGVGGYSSEFKPRQALTEFNQKIASRFPQIANGDIIESRGGRIPVGGVLRRIANRNGVLIGDAAGAVSPLTAGGLDPCMRLSNYAAEIIIRRLETQDPSVLLDISGKQFRTRFISRLWMRRILAVFTYQTLIETGCAFLRSKLGRKLATHVFFGRGSFPDIDTTSNHRMAENS